MFHYLLLFLIINFLSLSWFLRLYLFYGLLTAYFLYEKVMSVRLYVRYNISKSNDKIGVFIRAGQDSCIKDKKNNIFSKVFALHIKRWWATEGRIYVSRSKIFTEFLRLIKRSKYSKMAIFSENCFLNMSNFIWILYFEVYILFAFMLRVCLVGTVLLI